MDQSLITFHFNALKAGQIIKQFCEVRGISKASLAAKTGVSYDTVDNFFRGMVKEVQFERIFKYCVVLGVPLELFTLQWLEGEHIDFADEVLLYNPDSKASTAAELPPGTVADSVPDTVAAVADAVTHIAQTIPHIHDDSIRSDPANLLAVTERNCADRLSDMAASRQLLIEQHDKAIAVLCQQLERQDQLIRMLCTTNAPKGGGS